MAELKDLVQFALDKQPSKFKDAFNDLVSQRVVNTVDELKSEISANMFGESPEDDDEDLADDEDSFDDEDLDDIVDDLDDEDLDGLIEFDDEDMLDDDEDVDFDDEDIEESFNEENSEAYKEAVTESSEMRKLRKKNNDMAVRRYMSQGHPKGRAKKIVDHENRAASDEDMAARYNAVSDSKRTAKHNNMAQWHYGQADRLSRIK